jgi:hypothetical protein
VDLHLPIKLWLDTIMESRDKRNGNTEIPNSETLLAMSALGTKQTFQQMWIYVRYWG